MVQNLSKTPMETISLSENPTVGRLYQIVATILILHRGQSLVGEEEIRVKFCKASASKFRNKTK